jgi:hypothetical protein
VRSAVRLACIFGLAAAGLGGCALPGGQPASAPAGRPRAPARARARVPARAREREPARARVPAPARVAIAERTHEYPSPAPPLEHAPARSGAELALLLFATAYVNWNASDVSERLRALAAASVGQARSAMVLEAAQVASDPQLRAGGVANHGSVEAIAPLIGGGGGGDSYVVVTREWTSASASAAYQGLLPAWHVTLATVRAEGRGWVVSGWQPES